MLANLFGATKIPTRCSGPGTASLGTLTTILTIKIILFLFLLLLLFLITPYYYYYSHFCLHGTDVWAVARQSCCCAVHAVTPVSPLRFLRHWSCLTRLSPFALISSIPPNSLDPHPLTFIPIQTLPAKPIKSTGNVPGQMSSINHICNLRGPRRARAKSTLVLATVLVEPAGLGVGPGVSQKIKACQMIFRILLLQ